MADTFRALCAELLNVFDSYDDQSNLAGIFDEMKANKIDLIDRARAALANEPAVPAPPADGEVARCLADSLKAFLLTQDLADYPADHWSRRAAELLQRQAPVPAPPSDGEVAALVCFLQVGGSCPAGAKLTRNQCRRVVELLQRQVLVSVPVSERLPGLEDCDAKGRCWWWYPPAPEQTYGYWAHEDDAIPERSIDEQPTHWLPAHALPLPEVGE